LARPPRPAQQPEHEGKTRHNPRADFELIKREINEQQIMVNKQEKKNGACFKIRQQREKDRSYEKDFRHATNGEPQTCWTKTLHPSSSQGKATYIPNNNFTGNWYLELGRAEAG